MNIDIKKIYYTLLIVLFLSGCAYYAYKHETLAGDTSATLLQNNNTNHDKEPDYTSSIINKVGNNCPDKFIDNDDGTCVSMDSMGHDGGYKIIYETEAESENECTSFERFNNQLKTCYYECDTEEECNNIENKINSELESWIGNKGADSTNINSDKNEADNKVKITENQAGLTVENTFASFFVLPGEKIRYESIRESKGRLDYYITIWNKVAALSPDDISDNYIEEFAVYKNDKDDTIAFVDDEDSNGKWRIAINEPTYTKQNKREQYMTLIHELAHIISLNNDQMLYTDKNITSKTDISNIEDKKYKCVTLLLDEGCLKDSSYLYKFYTNFKNDIWGKGENEIEKILLNDKKKKEFDNNFITQYASTNEIEDFAESFTYFVIGDYSMYRNYKDDQKEKDFKDKHGKVSSMYEFENLVNIRKDMRTVLSREILGN